MKASSFFLGVAGIAGLSSALPSNTTASTDLEEQQLESRQLLASIGFIVLDLFASDAYNGIKGALFGTGTDPVDLSEDSLQKIADIFDLSLEDFYLKRDKDLVDSMFTNANSFSLQTNYSAWSPEFGSSDETNFFNMISSDIDDISDMGDEAGELAGYLDNYGLKGAPVYILTTAFQIAMRKEELRLQLLRDAQIDKNPNPNVHGTGADNLPGAIEALADQYSQHMANLRVNFEAQPQFLYRRTASEKTTSSCSGGLYPSCCHGDEWRGEVQSRKNEQANWDNVVVGYLCARTCYDGHDAYDSCKVTKFRQLGNDMDQSYRDWWTDNTAPILTDRFDDVIAEMWAAAGKDVAAERAALDERVDDANDFLFSSPIGPRAESNGCIVLGIC